MQHVRKVTALRKTLLDTFRPIIGAGRPVAIVDHPSSRNCGDHAIWLGEKALLKDLGIEVVYECSMKSYDRAALARALGNGTILMHGGGNFGDLYEYHGFRLDVLRDFPDNEVVIFPQTVMFFSDGRMQRSAESIRAHGKTIIVARDAMSLFVLKKYFGGAATSVPAPDAAVALGPLRRTAHPDYDIVWISRTDKESQFGQDVFNGLDAPNLRRAKIDYTLDGNIETIVDADVAGRQLMVTDWYRGHIANRSRAAFESFDFDQRSQYWLNKALRLLSAGQVVVTDRLHGHILCMMAGIPHVLLDNNYGKNFNYYRTWSRPLNICRLATTPEHAWKLAQELLRREQNPAAAHAHEKVERSHEASPVAFDES